MTRLSLPSDLPGPCPVCGETVIHGRFSSEEHIGHVEGYNRAIADVVACLRMLDQVQSKGATLAKLIERGDAFGAGTPRRKTEDDT